MWSYVFSYDVSINFTFKACPIAAETHCKHAKKKKILNLEAAAFLANSQKAKGK